MLPELPPDLVEAQRTGVSLCAGEAEGHLTEVFADALAGALRPLYNYMNELPGLQQAVTPFLPIEIVRRYAIAKVRSMPGVAVRSRVASARSLMSKAANPAGATLTMWSSWSA
jgi:hypothetical protein